MLFWLNDKRAIFAVTLTSVAAARGIAPAACISCLRSIGNRNATNIRDCRGGVCDGETMVTAPTCQFTFTTFFLMLYKRSVRK